MVEKLRKSRELLAAPFADAMVDFLLVRWRTQMLVQRHQRPVPAMAQVALVLPAIETSTVGLVAGVLLRGPSEQLVGQDAVCVSLVDDLVDGLAVQVACPRARTGLEVMSYTASRGVTLLLSEKCDVAM